MKEDILEQLACDYLQVQGYFTVCNVKFRPERDDDDYDAKKDSVHSDIDVLGYNPLETGPNRVVAVSCKSWQSGFDPKWELKQIDEGRIVSGREAWRRYRELCNKKWALAFRRAVESRTGSTEFTYITAVTRLIGDRAPWEGHALFRENLKCDMKVITLKEMVNTVLAQMTETVANSELGRVLQLMRAAGLV